jgi:hypothetical protein
MTEIAEKNETGPKFTPESLNDLDQAIRRWAVTTQFEQDLENYEKLKQQYD